MMRSLFTCLLGLGLAVATAMAASASRPATTDEVVLLTNAVRKYTGDLNRWAYTETAVRRDDKGRAKSETKLRYDPSQPPEQQWTPLLIDGKAPTERDLSRYRRRGEQSSRANEVPGTRRRYTLGELIQFEAARIVEEDARELVYELPLRKENNNRFPPEKFLVLARIDKTGQSLTQVSVRLRESFRQKLVIKIKSGEGILDFTTVDPQYAPVLASIKGDASASVLFVSVGGTYELQRTEYKRVKPYDERFGVQVGDLKALDF